METLTEAMDRVRQHTTLKAYCDAHLEPRPKDGRNHYACPNCQSGHRQGGTAAFHIDGDRLKCFSCGWRGDLFDLAGLLNGTEDKAEQCNLVAEWAGVEGWGDTWRDWDGRPMGGAGGDSKAAKDKDGSNTHEGEKKAQETASEGQNDHRDGRERHRAYIKAAQANIEHPEAVAYLSSRGIDLETARAWGLGYDPNPPHGWQDEGKQWHRSGRIVIPWPSVGGEEPYYHVDRAIDARAKNLKYDKPKREDVGEQPLWNPNALKAPAFFVVEGQMDALAVAACGYEAVALGTTKDSDLAERMEEAEDVGLALLMLDNDEAGRKAQAKMADELGAKGLPFLMVDTEEMGVKDAGEAWAADRESLKFWLGQWHDRGVAERERAEAEAYAKQMEALGLYDPADVTAGLFTMEDVLAPIPTGLGCIDGAIGGGLPAQGLVTLGAISSVGKTTLVHQICDNVAAYGRPVLFCSVEQGRQEIAAKSISRLMAGMARGSSGGRIVASAQAILNKDERRRWEAEDGEKVAAFTRACEIYHERTHREDGTPTLYIMEPSKPPTVAEIRAAAEAIRRRNGQAPIVAVDYVQLLAAPAGLERGTDKQILDRSTLDLRQMARDMQTCVIAISSLNRASYAGSIDLNSFKESGMLEYSSDLLLGMQPYGLQEAMSGKSEDSGKARAEAKKIMREYKESDHKEVELVILKNRNGGIGRSPHLTFEGIVSKFTESAPPRRKSGPVVL